MGCEYSKGTDTCHPPNKRAPSFKKAYCLGEKVEEGKFSVVKKGTNKSTGKTFLIKIVTKSELSHEDDLALKDEISILRVMDHKHIIRLYEVFDESSHYYLVVDLIQGGELFDRIATKSHYNEKEARDVCKILFEALNHCHSKSVAHRNLKPQNLLLMSKNNDSEIKIADFGFAKRTTSETCLLTQCGTPDYIAPEILEGVPYGTKADMWSLGVITYHLLGGYPPFIETNREELFRKIRQGRYEFHVEYWGRISSSAKDLISSLLTVDPQRRLTAQEAINGSWITGDDAMLEGNDLGVNLLEFKKSNAKRKFKC